MKNRMCLICSLIALSFSCDKSIDDTVNQRASNNVSTVKIEIGGDFVVIESSPLTRSENGKALYGIQIDSIDSNSNYCHYAQGLFDDISNLAVELENGHRYRFKCSVLVGSVVDKLFTRNNYYYMPFSTEGVLITNSFIYSHDRTMNLDCEEFYLPSINGAKAFPFASNSDRYYGIFEDSQLRNGYEGNIVINTKRCAFGVHFDINPPDEGTLYVDLSYPISLGDGGYYGFAVYKITALDSCIDEYKTFATSQFVHSFPARLKVWWVQSTESSLTIYDNSIDVTVRTMVNINVDINARKNESTQMDIIMDGSYQGNDTITIN